MNKRESNGELWHSMICLSLAVRFKKDKERLGLAAAVERLRDGLAYNGLTLHGDGRLLAGVLDGNVSSVELAEGICSAGRMGLVNVPALQ
jgi:hypothetical protein